MDTATARPSIFISYSRKDGKWLDAVTTMLAPVVRTGIASVWWDKKIKPSQVWREEIEAALASAQVAVLLVSPHFLASDFIQNEELPFLVDAARKRKVKLLWVLVSPCLYEHSPLQGIQAAHDVSKSLSKLQGADRQEALASISRAVVEALGEGTPSPAPRGRDGVGDPPLHNLPYSRLGDLFTGRQEELEALSGNGTAAITQGTALSGLGGIGKTRLAVEYAWRAGNRHTAAWFVRADSPESLRRNLAALAGPELMNLPEHEARIEDQTIAAVKRWLREHPGWLMILDNVDTPEAAQAVLEVLPSLSNGRVLITSRLTTWPASVRKQELAKLSREEAVRFLLHRTEDGRAKADDDDRQALALAEALDGLPLALEQAAAFILRRRLRLADYLRAWERERSEVLKWHDPRAMEYPAPVAVTWKQTFDRLSPTSAALLRLMAFLAPDPIPVDMFEKGVEFVEEATQRLCEETGKAPDELSIQAGLDELADYSLITRQDGEMVAVHRMVQEVLKSQIPGTKKDWIEWALRIVDLAFPLESDDVRTWPICDRLRPHATKIAALADEEGITDPTGRLMNQLGVLFRYKGLYAEAEPLMRRALGVYEDSLGPAHEYVTTALSNLALLLQDTDRLEEAESLMRRALEIDEASFGEEHPDIAIDLNNLAALLKSTNRLEEAEPLMRRALDIDEASFGKEHPNVARDLNNLAQLLKSTNRVEEAEPLMRRALNIDEASFGKEHPRVATVLNNLARLLQDTNRLEEAEPLMRRALDIDEASLGKEHPEVATDLNNLARLLQDTNRLEEAEPLMRRAVEILERSLGPDHPRTQLGRRNLAGLLAKMAAAGVREGGGGDDGGDGVSGDAPGPAPG